MYFDILRLRSGECPCRCNPDPPGGGETASPNGERLVIKRWSAWERRRYASSRRKPRAEQVIMGNVSEGVLRRRHAEPAKRLKGRPKSGMVWRRCSHWIHRTTRTKTRRKAPPYPHDKWTFGTGQPVVALCVSRVGNQLQVTTEKDASRSKGLR